MIAEAALLCLSFNVYFEARGEPILGQYAVAQVTMNRAKHDISKVCGVVFAPKQFSWTNTKVERVGVNKYRLKRPHAPKNEQAWDVAVIIAGNVLHGRMKHDLSQGATDFHAKQVDPFWKRYYVKVASFGNHLFYRRK
jgi:N-acetylmuramoyl-L-alanine amidase